ncbi:hypothetical protein [Streptomyces sp. NBC_01439]|uniref:hypothetical protein n=1 Tax=Streptomyces sp. NBC_01439 TaxID=2903867 RepID=UPI002E2D118B|nr:hypothetical protein [Streptomyces sp. NBC_01439]
MAGMRIVVCLPGEARTRLDEALAEAMAPFEIDFTRDEELDIWDGWTICGNGSYRDGFQLLPGYEDDPRIVREVRDDGVPGWCAGGPREAMAFAEIRAEARDIARAAWDLWRELARSHPPAQPRRVVWDSPWPTSEEYRAGREADQEAGAAFDAQPLVVAYREGVAALLEAHRGYYLGGFLQHGAAAESVGWTGREDFAAAESAGTPWHQHVLTLDGWWYGEDEPAVHGECDGPDACVHRPPLPWLRDTARTGYLEELPGDTLLVKLRCHV